LTRDGFSIAIHLILKKLAGQDVPSKLPPSLMPPSARVSALGTSTFSPVNAQSHQEPEPAMDLSSIDDTPPSSALPQQPPNALKIIEAESYLSAVHVEKAEIEGDFLRDKEEAEEVDKRLIEKDKQIEALKADVERLKKEAKRQKGLLAVAKRHLSTKESERAQAERELAEAVEKLSSITRDKDTVDAELAIMTSPAPKVAQRTLSFDAFTSLPSTSTTKEDYLKLPGSDLLPASSTFDLFSAVQSPSQPSSSSSSSSKNNHDEPKEPQVRHSELSVRPNMTLLVIRYLF
jgi:hypothetical protein